MKKISLREARDMQLAGIEIVGYEVTERSLEAMLIDALKKNTAFVTHWDYQIIITSVSEKSAFVYSMKDNSRYKIDFELDANDEPRITKIMPLAPPEIPMREQLSQRAAAGLLNEKDLPGLKKLHEQDQKATEKESRVLELKHMHLAGLIDGQEYERRLVVERTRGEKQKPLLESDDPTQKRAALWEQYYNGKLTLEETVTRCAEIRLAAEHSQPRLLTEQKCDDDCDCPECHLENFKEVLESRVAAGTMTRAQADRCFAIRCKN